MHEAQLGELLGQLRLDPPVHELELDLGHPASRLVSRRSSASVRLPTLVVRTRPSRAKTVIGQTPTPYRFTSEPSSSTATGSLQRPARARFLASSFVSPLSTVTNLTSGKSRAVRSTRST